jgi:hypothetical protein
VHWDDLRVFLAVYHPDLKTVARVRRVGEWIRATFRDARPELQGRRSPAPAARTGTH